MAARFALRSVELILFGERVTFAHLVVSKSQQSVEKLTKGYLLWHSQSFDPTKGHSPFTEVVKDQPQIHKKALARLKEGMKIGNKMLVRELEWLESLAPRPPEVVQGQQGDLQPLEIIRENTEYPFWSASGASLVIPAKGITLHQGERAFRTLRGYLTVLSMSDPIDYCGPIWDFINRDHRMSTEIAEWPPS